MKNFNYKTNYETKEILGYIKYHRNHGYTGFLMETTLFNLFEDSYSVLLDYINEKYTNELFKLNRCNNAYFSKHPEELEDVERLVEFRLFILMLELLIEKNDEYMEIIGVKNSDYICYLNFKLKGFTPRFGHYGIPLNTWVIE